MLSRAAKTTFYAVAGPLMRLNGWRHRVLGGGRAGARVHLGPGQKKYIPGWVNCDANIFTGKADRWVDLRNALPFKEGRVAALYSHHVIEHLPDVDAHMRDAFRVLQPGGVYRVAGPDLDVAIDRYQAGDLDWFGTWPVARRTPGGRINTYLLCAGEHVALLSEDLLRELMEDAGFTDIRRVAPRTSGRPDLFGDVFAGEEEPAEHQQTLVMEGTRPA